MHYVEDVINVAKEEIGYFEKATDKGLDKKTSNVGNGHYTKYARDLDNIGFYNTCQNGIRDVFIPWCFVQAFGANAAKEMCNIPTDACADYNSAIEYYGQLYHEPKIGDQVFFYDDEKNISGTALVELVTNKLVYTIGLGIFGISRNCYELDDSSIAGYGRPKYDVDKKKASTSKKSDAPAVAKPTLKNGNIGAEVTKLQKDLNYLSFKGKDGKKLTVDGEFGTNTTYALKHFQKKYKLEVDGIYGAASCATMKSNVK